MTNQKKQTSEAAVREIRRRTRRKFSPEEKIRIVLEGLREYVDYYNTDRVHTQLRDSPIGRPTEPRPSSKAQIVGLPRVGGLHHRYEWQEAA